MSDVTSAISLPPYDGIDPFAIDHGTPAAHALARAEHWAMIAETVFANAIAPASSPWATLARADTAAQIAQAWAAISEAHDLADVASDTEDTP